MIIEAEVPLDAIVLVLHSSTQDLDLLQKLMAKVGHQNILPRVENCITIVQQYRAGLPTDPITRKVFPAALDVLFPILFAGHSLVGSSHRALPDIFMLREMVLLLIHIKNLHQKVSWVLSWR